MNKIRQCVRKERERQETKRMLAEGRKMTLGEMRFTPKAERPRPSEPRLSLSACSTAPVRSGRNQTSPALGCRAQSRSRKMRNYRLLDSFFFLNQVCFDPRHLQPTNKDKCLKRNTRRTQGCCFPGAALGPLPGFTLMGRAWPRAEYQGWGFRR